MIRNTHSAARRRALGVQGQRGGGRRRAERAGSVRTRRPASTATRRARAPRDEGRDAQPSDCDLAVPGGRDGLGRRDPRRGRDRPRREAEGRAHGLHRLAPRHSRLAQPWERATPASRSASRRRSSIMLDGPIGAASFNNEFGRPNLAGYFRTFELDGGRRMARLSQADHDRRRPGQRARRARREGRARPGAKLIVLGGPAMLIGLGGGAASSQGSGAGEAELDFASVQRGNAEMQRRAQEVIDRAGRWGTTTRSLRFTTSARAGCRTRCPRSSTTVGCGAVIDLRAIPSDEPGMSPMELWCNESQERYMLAIERARRRALRGDVRARALPVRGASASSPAKRELVVRDPTLGGDAGRHADGRAVRQAAEDDARRRRARRSRAPAWRREHVSLSAAVDRVLAFPAVADKSFLITHRRPHGRRLDACATSSSALAGAGRRRRGHAAELRRLHAARRWRWASARRSRFTTAPASARLAVGEAITNIAAADVAALGDIRLSANWMAAAGARRRGRRALCDGAGRRRGAVPGAGHRDSGGQGLLIDAHGLERRRRKQGRDGAGVADRSAFAPVRDVRRTLTPELARERGTRRSC